MRARYEELKTKNYLLYREAIKQTEVLLAEISTGLPSKDRATIEAAIVNATLIAYDKGKEDGMCKGGW